MHQRTAAKLLGDHIHQRAVLVGGLNIFCSNWLLDVPGSHQAHPMFSHDPILLFEPAVKYSTSGGRLSLSAVSPLDVFFFFNGKRPFSLNMS